MSFAKLKSAQPSLLKAQIIDIEVDLSRGLHAFAIVGLPDKAVEEARDRISAAIKNSGFTSPKNKNQKVVISLAPADLKKEGPVFDLGMALAYLLATKDVDFDSQDKIFLGELSLDGNLRAVKGILPIVEKVKNEGFKEIFLPKANAEEAALISGVKIFGANSLVEVIAHLVEKEVAGIKPNRITAAPPTKIPKAKTATEIDMKDIRGQEAAKRGLEIAAAGGHNIALFGPPGTGKTLLAKAFAGILPELTFPEMLEVTSIHSVAGLLTGPIVATHPFRSPHHTASYVSIVGGGANPKPGEVTLAHRGVLFMDEFPEFERRVIDALRQPLEDGVVHISRAKGSAAFPAKFLLVAAMNPCPCGNYGFRGKPCVCTPVNILRYQRKISGPILDRIDLWLEAPHVNHELLSGVAEGEGTKEIRERVIKARTIQNKRFKKLKLNLEKNSDLGVKDLVKAIILSEESKRILNESAQNLGFSPRVYHKIIKISRTIADLAGEENILPKHILEAIQYRPKKQFTS